MAQHYLTKSFKQKKFRDIEKGIEYAFKKSRGLLKTSMQFQYIAKEGDDTEIYACYRKIPKGIIAGYDIGNFEIWYSVKEKKIINIYLVA